MIIQHLTIHNIASFEDAAIDFATGPLSEAPVFLITGPTGAGKSTILDAICLALYNKTPRTGQRSSRDKGIDDIPLNNSVQLMRRNTKEAWIELDIIGNDDKPYTLRWQCRRRPKSIELVRTLIDRHSKASVEIKKASEAEIIERIIGLTFSQFCRTTMLAQGEFTKFLNGKDEERAEILEKLTGTDVYSAIGSRIYAITKEKAIACDTAMAVLKNIIPLTVEETDAYNSEIAKLNDQLTTLQHLTEDLTHKRQWLMKYDELKAEQSNAQKQLDELDKAINCEEFITSETIIADWNKSSEARNLILRIKEASASLEKINHEKRLIHKDAIALYRFIDQLKSACDKEQVEIERLTQWLRNKEEDAAMYAKCDMIIAGAKNASTIRKHILSGRNELIIKRQNLSVLEAKDNEVKSKLNRQKDASHDKATRLKELEESYEHLNPAQLHRDFNSVMQQSSLLERCKNAVNEHSAKADALKAQQDKNDMLIHEAGAAATSLDKARKRHSDAKEAYDDFLKFYDRQKQSVADWAKEARQSLKAGDTCPVCGTTVEHILSDDAFEEMLAPAIIELEKRKTEMTLAHDELSKADVNMLTVKNLLIQSADMLKVCDKDEKESSAKMTSLLDEANTGIENIETESKRLTEEKEILTHKNEQAEQIRKQAEVCRNELDKINKAIEMLSLEDSEIEKQIASLTTDCKNQEHKLAHDSNEYENALLLLNEMVTMPDWIAEWHKSPDSFYRRIETEAEKYFDTGKRLDHLSSTHKENHELIKRLQNNYDAITGRFPAEEGIRSGLPAPAITDIESFTANLSDRSAALHTLLEQTRKSRTQLMAALDESLISSDMPRDRVDYILSNYEQSDIDLLISKHRDMSNQHVRLSALSESVHKRIEAHVEMRPQLSPADSIDGLSLLISQQKAAIDENNRSIGKIQNLLKENELNNERLKTERKHIDRLCKERDSWQRLNAIFGSATGDVFKRIAQSFVLKDLLLKANIYLGKFTERYELTCRPDSLLILVRDLYQGATVRPSNTLSGGESFLVSLALALGLSSLSPQGMSMDTMFIDEGFGTLSEEYLNSVMDTLHKLNTMSGKRVGVISHVDNLRERIPTQIQVSRSNNSTGTITLRG